MRIAVLDDNGAELDATVATLRAVIEAFYPDAEILPYASAEALIAAIREGAGFYIAFLDILMEPPNGMDAAREIRKRDPDCRIVFLTSSEAYAVESYDVRATHYLLKPVARERLAAALALCVDARRRNARYIQVTAARQERRVLLGDILYAQVQGNAVRLYLPDESLSVYTSYRRFAPSLLADSRFLQCFHGCIINMDHIVRIEGNSFILDSGDAVPFRVRSAARIRNAYMEYLFIRLRKEGSV